MRVRAAALRADATLAEQMLARFAAYASGAEPPGSTPSTPIPIVAAGSTGGTQPPPTMIPPTPAPGGAAASNAGKGAAAAGGQKAASGDGSSAPTPAAAATPDCSGAIATRAALAQGALSNPAYRERIEKVKQLAANLSELADSLNRFTNPDDWDGSSFVFFRSRASAELKKTITIKVTPLAFNFDNATMTRAQIDTKAKSTSFVLRQYQTLVPELAAGLVISSVKAPQFGTGQDAAGKTIIVRQPDKEVSYAGALLLNWVLAEPATSALQPMFQTGVSLGADGPAILAGVGTRIGRPKRVAFAVGAALAWVKDLDKLREGGPVTGTAELKADLRYAPTVKAYFTLQYQFKE
jgi:hypothetical protein